MRYERKPVLAVLLTAILVFALLAGCTPGISTQVTTAAANTTTAAVTTEPTSAISNINLDSMYPIVKKPIDVTIAVQYFVDGVDPDKFVFNQYMDDNTNMNINWIAIDPSVSGEKIATMFATSDIPDLILGHWFDASAITVYGVTEGVLRPVEDLIEYMPNFTDIIDQNPEIKPAITASDNHIYGFPKLLDSETSFGLRFWINSNWMKALNLKDPETLDDFYKVLVAFRDNDLNSNGKADEIPLCISWGACSWLMRSLILNTFGYSTGGSLMAVNYNNAVSSAAYLPLTDEYLEYLKFMNKLWTAELLDPDTFTMTDVQQTARASENVVGVTWAPNNQTIIPDDANAFTTLKVMSANESYTGVHPGWPMVDGKANGVISADVDFETAVALARINDSFYNVEFSLLSEEADRGSEFSKKYLSGFGAIYDQANDKWEVNFPTDFPNDWAWRVGAITPHELPGFGSRSAGLSRYSSWAKSNTNANLTQRAGFYSKHGSYDPWTQMLVDDWGSHKKLIMPSLFLSDEDNLRVKELEDQLETYISSMEAKFITGDKSLGDYAEFQAELKALGAQEFQEIYQKYYDQYLKVK